MTRRCGENPRISSLAPATIGRASLATRPSACTPVSEILNLRWNYDQATVLRHVAAEELRRAIFHLYCSLDDTTSCNLS